LIKLTVFIIVILLFTACSQNVSDAFVKAKTGTPAYRVLCVGDRMIRDCVLVKGSCWDYIDATFTKAGYSRLQRVTIFKSKKHGPYANINRIQAGDWLYFINGSYHNSEHSAVFIKWIDRRKKIACMLSYQGEGKRKPARYRNYHLDRVYHIMRAGT
jgi:hypothetical protein